MGRLSGKPGPDPKELIKETGGEAYEEEQLDRLLAGPTKIYTFHPPWLKVLDMDAEGHMWVG